MKWAIFQENINSPNGQKKKKKGRNSEQTNQQS